METKAVMTKAITMLVGNASSAKANAKVEQGDSFGSILNKSTAQNRQADQAKVDTAKDSVGDKEKFSVAERPETTNVAQTNPETAKTDAKASAQEPAASEEVKDVIEAVSEEVAETVKDALQMSDEEFEELLAQMGITAPALLDMNTLQQFVLKATGHTDAAEMLTDEGLAQTYQNLVEQLDSLDIAKSLGITEEQLTQLVQEAVEKGPEAFKEVFAEAAAQGKVLVPMEMEPSVEQEEPEAVTAPSVQGENDAQTVVIKNPSLQESSSDDTHMQDGHHEKHGKGDEVNPWQSFTQGLVNAAGDAAAATQTSARMAQMIDIVNQIIEQVKVNLTKETTSMEIQLNPESLGKVNLTVSAKEGVMVANFAVQSEMAKEALESQMHILKEQFDQKGIKVEAVEVTVTDFAFAQSDQTEGGNQGEQQKKAKGRTISMEELQKEADAEESEEETAGAAIGSGGNIDYTV